MTPLASYPKISIITPSYNQGQFLEATIRSVLDQAYPNLEYIVIDGGSTDNSVALIKQHENRLAYWVSEKDHGQPDAINKGLRRATGDVLAWLNSDDVYCPGALRAVAAFLGGQPHLGAVIGDLDCIDERGAVVAQKRSVPVTFRTSLYTGCAVPQPATFFRRAAWESTGELDASLHYLLDYEYFLRMQARGVRFGLLPQPLAKFRLHGDSKTVSQYQRDFWADFLRVQRPYLPQWLPDNLAARFSRVMRWGWRCKLYCQRVLLRGPEWPFEATRARKRTTVSARA